MSDEAPTVHTSGLPWLTRGGLLAVLVLGAIFRLIWVEDIEYKLDEAFTFAQVRRVLQGEGWPWVGMPSSQEVANPGLSLWVFVGLGALNPGDEPTSLARVIQIGNVLALVGLVLFARYVVPAREREAWYWAVALAAVNPLTVLCHRKIWPPCVLPPLLLLLWLGWWYRERRWGAFLWGAMVLVIGQIHMFGFFLAVALVVTAWFYQRRQVRWGWWGAGSFLGALPMVPWVYYLLTEAPPHVSKHASWGQLLLCRFWLYWISDPLGYTVEHNLGNRMGDFLASPYLWGKPTYLMLLCHAALLSLGAFLLVRGIRRWWVQRGEPLAPADASSPTKRTLVAAMGVCGVILMLGRLPIHRHYLLVVFPLVNVWLARLALGTKAVPSVQRLGRLALLGLVLLQALMTTQMMCYLHQHGGADVHGFGVSYGVQARTGQVTQAPPEWLNLRQRSR